MILVVNNLTYAILSALGVKNSILTNDFINKTYSLVSNSYLYMQNYLVP
jgi:hypothetical protein